MRQRSQMRFVSQISGCVANDRIIDTQRKNSRCPLSADSGRLEIEDDDLVLLKWVSLESQELGALDRARPGVAVSFDPFSVRELGLAFYISKTEISESLHRSVDAGLAIRSHGRIKPNRRNMLEFIMHGLKYAFPSKKGAPERGVTTAFAAPMLQGDLISAGSEILCGGKGEGRFGCAPFQVGPSSRFLGHPARCHQNSLTHV